MVLNKIYTRPGDTGDTALGNGKRVAKHAAGRTVLELDAAQELNQAGLAIILFHHRSRFPRTIWGHFVASVDPDARSVM